MIGKGSGINGVNNPLSMAALPEPMLAPVDSCVTTRKSYESLVEKHINIANEVTISIRPICRFSIKLSKK
jgi:hypothetical protein